MRTADSMTVYRMEALFSLLIVLLAATHCQAAGVNETGVNSTDLQVVAAQPMMVSCDAPSPLEKYDSYCEGLQADYFLLPKQRLAPSLTGLKPNVSTFVTSLNDTAAALSFKGVNALIAAKTYSFAVRYTGVLFFDIAGRYDFSLNSPAGTRLTINGNTITFNQGSNASTPTTGYTFSKAGYLPIELVFFNENSVPSLKVQWTGPADDGVMTVIEGSSIQFNCSSLQNNTNSVPAKTSSFCPGLSAVYYSDWTNSSFATATGGAATYAIYEQGLNHWSTSTTPYWARLPPTLRTSFSGRFHGQLWIPLPGTYTFKLQATRAASLFIGNDRVLNSTAVNGVAQAKTVTYSFATAGYTPVGLNFISRKVAPTQAGVLRLAWKGPNSPAFKVVYGFNHPCSSFVACSNATTAGALPAEVVGTPPAGTTVESASAIRTSSLATFIPNSNVTFTLGFPGLTAEDPSVEDVSYFVREAIANAAGLRLESVWTVPSLDDEGEVVFPIGAYFTSVASAMRFYNLVNLRPDTIFSNSAGLYDFYPITVSSPDMGTRVAASSATVQAPRRVARLASADGIGNDIPLPPTPAPSPTATPNATAVANVTSNERVNSPSPTAAPTPTAAAPEAPVPPVPSIPEAIPSTPVATPVAPAPAPQGTETPASTPAASPVAPAPGNGGLGVPQPAVTPVAPAPEESAMPVQNVTAAAPAPEGTAKPLPAATPVAMAPAPEGTAKPVMGMTPVAAAPASEGTAMPLPAATPVAMAPAPEGTAVPVPVATPVAAAPGPEGTAMPVMSMTPVAAAPEETAMPLPVATPVAMAPAPEGTAMPVPIAPAPAPEGTAVPVPTATAAAPAPEGTAVPVPVATPVAAAPAPQGTAMPVPVAPAPAPEETAMPTATPVAPAPSPVPADLPSPVPTAMPTPMAPSPAPVAPDMPAPTPTPSTPGRTVGGARVPAATPYGTSTPTAMPYGSPATSPTAAPTPMAYAPSGAVPGSAPAPAPGVPPSTTMSAGMASPAMYPSPGMAGSPSGSPAPAPYAAPPTGGVSPTAGPVMGDLSAPSPAPTAYPAPPPGGIAPSGGPVMGSMSVPSPAPTAYPAPPPGGIEPSGGPSVSGGMSASSPAPTPYATPYATPTSGSPLPGPSPAPSPAPTSYPVPPFVDPVPAPTPYPVSSPITTSPSAYSPPPSPYSPVTLPAPTSPALTIPEDAILVYAPPPTPITFASPSPATITYYSPSPAIRGAPVGITYYSPSPSQGGTGSDRSPMPTQTPSSTSPRLFGASSPIFDTPPSTPGAPISTPPTDFCAYGGSSYFVPYSQRAGGYLVPCSSMATPGSPPQPSPYGDSPNPYMSPNPIGYSPGFPMTPSPPGAPAVSPTPARLPVYYGLPVTCPPGAASCRAGPYAYYAPRGNQPLTPAAEAALLGQSPSVRSPSPLPSPRAMFGSAPAPAMGPLVAPAPAPTAQCACDPTDATPRSVKLEVLSTAYNSTSSDTIRFNAYLTFSHPTRSLNSSQVRVFTRQPSDDLTGTVTTPGVVSLLEPISQNCAFYSLKGYVMESNPFAVNTTSIFLAAGGDILDACGSPFNVTVTRVEQANRLSGQLYATGVAYSEEAGALLDGNVLDLALAFTQPVPRLSANMFSVTGPPRMTSTDLERVDGSDSYFTFSVTLPENYYGSVKVAMNRAGRQYLSSINPSAVAPASLTLNRADPLTQGQLVNTTMTKTRSL